VDPNPAAVAGAAGAPAGAPPAPGAQPGAPVAGGGPAASTGGGCGCSGGSGSPAQQRPSGKKPGRKQQDRTDGGSRSDGASRSDSANSTSMNQSDAAMTKKIQAYLEKQGSPLAKHADDIVRSGKKHDVDPRLIVAIAGQESSFGKNNFEPYNAWGWMSGEDFSSWEQSIDRVARGLDELYVGQGLTSLSKIQQKWAPVGAGNDPTNLNSHWTTGVTKFYRELGGNPNDVTA
jgi:hypothetical protein